MQNLFAFMLFQDFSTGEEVAGGAAATGFLLVWLAFMVLMIAAMWKIFVKAGEPGWAAIIPIYNLYIILKIAGKPAWWLLLFIVPVVNLVVAIITYISFSQAFGKGAGFAFGLLLLPFIFFPLLAWGDSRYQGAPMAATA
jgi:hypothetical protein